MKQMNITEAKYLSEEGVNFAIITTIDGQTMSVPLDPANRHYAEILLQVAAGTLTIAAAS